jgi:hypothetical protein
MDSLKQLFTSTQGGTESTPSTAGTIAGLGSLGAGGFGTLSNIINAMRQAGLTSEQRNYMNQMMMLANNPTLLAQKAMAYEQPLSQDLLNNVGNKTQAILGERGLSSSPAQAQQITAETLAPYALQQQQTAEQAVLGQESLPISASRGIAYPKVDASSFWQMLLPKPVTQGAQPASKTPQLPPNTTAPYNFDVPQPPPDTSTGDLGWPGIATVGGSFGGGSQ